MIRTMAGEYVRVIRGGVVTIPKPIREKLKIKSGDLLQVRETDTEIIFSKLEITPMKKNK